MDVHSGTRLSVRACTDEVEVRLQDYWLVGRVDENRRGLGETVEASEGPYNLLAAMLASSLRSLLASVTCPKSRTLFIFSTA